MSLLSHVFLVGLYPDCRNCAVRVRHQTQAVPPAGSNVVANSKRPKRHYVLFCMRTGFSPVPRHVGLVHRTPQHAETGQAKRGCNVGSRCGGPHDEGAKDLASKFSMHIAIGWYERCTFRQLPIFLKCRGISHCSQTFFVTMSRRQIQENVDAAVEESTGTLVREQATRQTLQQVLS